MSYQLKCQNLHAMVGQGQMLEAFEKYFHDEVVVIDGPSEPRNGKDAQRKALAEWASQIQEMHGGGVKGMTADEQNGITMAETWVDVTFKDGNRMKMDEVAVQKWDGDQIIHERFYYNAPDA